ncbi:MAG: cytochrome c biogenesis protein CcdA [Candidatus Dormibacter sp.]
MDTCAFGPVLGGILTLAGSTGRVGAGFVLLVLHGHSLRLGLGLPFLALSLSVNRPQRWLQRARRGITTMRLASGGLLAVMGVLLLTGE